MKVGDFVGRVMNSFGSLGEPEPLGIIVRGGLSYVTKTWYVLKLDGTIDDISENYLEVIQPA